MLYDSSLQQFQSPPFIHILQFAVYAQWKFPGILTNIVVNIGVEKFISNGSG